MELYIFHLNQPISAQLLLLEPPYNVVAVVRTDILVLFLILGGKSFTTKYDVTIVFYRRPL